MRCERCHRTHALLPSFLFARRLDLAAAIFTALAMAAAGAGHRAGAARIGVPESTARGWLRRARTLAPERHAAFAALAAELGSDPARAPPAPDRLAALLTAIGRAHGAARARFGAAAPASPAAFSAAASGGLLLANTSRLFPPPPVAVKVAGQRRARQGGGA